MNTENIEHAHAIKYTVGVHYNDKEIVYISDDTYRNFPRDTYGYTITSSVLPEYFTEDKILEIKKKICERIMDPGFSLSIYESDWDYYPVQKTEIWK